MSLADIIRSVGQSTQKTSEPANIIEFAESDWGLGKPDEEGRRFRLFPVQKIILKAHYGLALDDNPYGVPLDSPVPEDHPQYANIVELDPDSEDYQHYKFRVKVTDWRRQNERFMTEAEYLRYLYDTGRSNIREVDHNRRELVLSIGRRSGKTFLASVISAYETYKLLLKGDPQSYYGLPKANPIQIISVATDKDQAALLYQEVSGHYQNCGFFNPYTANATLTYAKFQTPKDIERYGRFCDDPTAKATIKITFKSCIAKGLRGTGVLVVILDEMAHFTDEGQSSADAVYKAITPATAAFTPKNPKDSRQPIGPVQSRIIAISSPMGRQGKFYKLFQQGMKGATLSPDMLCIQAPTWEVNPTIAADFLEAEYVKDATAFFTEYGGYFTDRTRGWIEKPEDLFACIQPNLRPSSAVPARRPHFVAIDLGLVNDPTAIAIGHLEMGERGPNVIVDLVDQIQAGFGKYVGVERLEFDEVADWVQGFSKRFYFAHGVVDQHAGDIFEQALAKRGLRQIEKNHFTDVENSESFRNFKDMMWDRRLVLYDFPIEEGHDHCAYIEQLLELQAEQKTKNIIKVEAPNIEGKHDDTSDALVRMVWLATQHMAKAKLIAGVHTGTFASRSGLSGGDYARSALAARRMGSSPDRQQSRMNRGRTMGR